MQLGKAYANQSLNKPWENHQQIERPPNITGNCKVNPWLDMEKQQTATEVLNFQSGCPRYNVVESVSLGESHVK
jgi:hypothetical protein